MGSREVYFGSVLVVGGAGSIGRYVVEAFLDEPSCSAVHVLSRTTPKDITLNVKYHEGDIRNFGELKKNKR
jgi:sterol-4alpha-carboxylate 3-dehydrogenase (decarboxylating)